MKHWTIWALLVLLAATGCRREAPRAASTDEAATYASLELTCESHDRELQAEISHLRAAGALPVSLDASRGIDTQSPQGESLSTVLATAFTSSKLAFARERTQLLFASSVDRWNPLTLEQALQFCAYHTQAQQSIARALDVPQARLNLPLAGGTKRSAICADAALVYVRLECITTADAVSRGDGEQAIAALQRAFCTVELLAAEPHVVARLTAVAARRDTLGAAQRLVDSRIVTTVQLAQLERIVGDELAHWPADSNAWIGDRALGLQTYEMSRAGQLLAVLTSDELNVLQGKDHNDVFVAAVARNIDHDQTYYLQAMRRYIALSNKPFYERVAAFESLQAELAELEDSPHYPLIADRLLLPGIAAGQRQQAADLALVRAWSMALAVACGHSLPPPEVNPLTGETYDVQIATNRVVVAGIDPRLPELKVTAPIAQAIRTTSLRSDTTPHQPR